MKFILGYCFFHHMALRAQEQGIVLPLPLMVIVLCPMKGSILNNKATDGPVETLSSRWYACLDL